MVIPYDSIIRNDKIYFAVSAQSPKIGNMPRRAPSPENKPVRNSWSLPQKLHTAGTRYAELHPAEAIRDFSDLLGRALAEYLEKHHPGLIAEAVAELNQYQTVPTKALMAAEGKAKYPAADILSGTAGALLNQIAAQSQKTSRARHK